jgi:hypothetical protein
MTDIQALKESIAAQLYAQEPLAHAILSYLSTSDPAAHDEILAQFDKVVSNRIDKLIIDALNKDAQDKFFPWKLSD